MNDFKDNTDTVTIPDFVEDKDSDSTSVDMSIFKMSDEELYDDVEPEKEEKVEVKSHKKKTNSTIILCLVLIVILFVIAVGGVIFAVKKNSELTKANEELTQVKATIADYQNKVNTLTEEVNSLNAKLEEAKSAGTKADPNNKYPKGSTLRITEDGGGQGVKKLASMDSDFTDITLYYGDTVTLLDDATVDADGNYWGKIDSGYIRIEYNGETWASIE